MSSNLIAAVIAAQIQSQRISLLNNFFDDLPSVVDARVQQHMQFNNFVHEAPLHQIPTKDILAEVFHDPPRHYMKLLGGLYGWEFLTLHDEVKHLIDHHQKNLLVSYINHYE